MKPKNLVWVTLLAVVLCSAFWWFTGPTAAAPEKSADAAIPVKTYAANQVMPPTVLPPVTSNQTKGAPSPQTASMDPQSDLKTALPDIVNLLRSHRDVDLFLKYAPPGYLEKHPTYLPELQDRVDQQLQFEAQNAGFPGTTSIDEEIAEMYDDLQSRTPTLNDAGDEATYTAHLLTTHPEVFVKIDGKWYMKDPPR